MLYDTAIFKFQGHSATASLVLILHRESQSDLKLVKMPQNEYVAIPKPDPDDFQELQLTIADILSDGKRNMAKERTRKRIARESHKQSQSAQKLTGLRAKLYQKKRHAEKIQMKKQIRAHEQRNVKSSGPSEPSSTPLPQYLLDRTQPTSAKALSSAIKNKRAEKAAKFSVPLPRVRGIAEEEMFKVVKTGKKTAKKGWKRMITKPTFVGPDFTRRPVKYERFIRPMGLRYKRTNVTHPELAVTVQLPIISVKKNPQNPMYTHLGVLTKGTIIEVNVSELGLVTAGGKVVWGRWAQITNNPENDGCLNA
ncbi:Ribosome biogenesis protein, partial [Sticta canariensis]|nr:Ribosome biogenesis protein [Sticta canariensis]